MMESLPYTHVNYSLKLISCYFIITLTNTAAIPHFKEVIIMATTCDACGHKTNEVKSGCKLPVLTLQPCQNNL